MSVIAIGEILLRIATPKSERWLQSPAATLCVGGAETNTLVALSQWANATRLVSALPSHEIGDAIARQLRGFGVDLSYVKRAAGRLGTYYLDGGALMRAPAVVYDREHSLFTTLSAQELPWDHVFANMRCLHVSGISPALGERSLELVQVAIREARSRGLLVSFDCNYRAALWQRWTSEPATLLRPLLEQADILFAEARDLEMCFSTQADPDRLAWSQEFAFDAIPTLQWLAQSEREVVQSDHHIVRCVLANRARERVHSERTELRGIIDRVGTGDAFAAGILHGYLHKYSLTQSNAFAHAAFVLKHSISGDFLIASETEVSTLAAGAGLQIRR